MIHPYERPLHSNTDLSKKQILLNNFLGGLAWGVGSVVGATVVVAILGYFLKAIGVFSAIGSFFGQFTNLNQPII